MPLTKDEIRSLLSDIENERVERTLSTDNTKKMSEAICSFANDIFLLVLMIMVFSTGRLSPMNNCVHTQDSVIPERFSLHRR